MKKYALKWCLIILCVVYATKDTIAQVSVAEKFKSQLAKFDSLNNISDSSSYKILTNLESELDYKNNDTLKLLVFAAWERYYTINADINKVNAYCGKCLDVALKSKLFSYASTCMGSKGMAYFQAGLLDSALTVFKQGLQYARQATDTFNINKSLMALANTYSRKSMYKESNEILLENVDKIVNLQTQAVAYATIADNYMALGSKTKLDHYFLKAIDNLRGKETNQLLWGTIFRYAGYLYNKEEYAKLLLYADSIVFYGNGNPDALSACNTLKANAYYGLKDYKQALVNINGAISLDAGNDYLLADDYKVRGNIYFEQGKNKEALDDFKLSLNYFGDRQEIAIKRELLENYVKASLKATNNDLYLKFMEFVEIKDSLHLQENMDKLAEFDVKYNSVQKDATIKQTKQRSRTYLLIGLLATLSAIVLSFLLYRIRNQKRLIELQKQEILHNNRNNIQLLVSIFERQSETESNKDTAKENQERLVTLNILNRLLYENQSENQAKLSTYLQRIAEAKAITCKIPIEIKFNEQELVLNSVLLKDIGLIINELISNSVKHAFDTINKPSIKIIINAVEKNMLQINYNDFGKGLPLNFDINANYKSFGLEFIKDLVAQHHGSIIAQNIDGANFVINLMVR
jgi:two-component sensor histidine kinase